VVTGLFQATPATYWNLNQIAPSGSSTQDNLAGLPAVDKAVQVTDDWSSFANQVSGSSPPIVDDSQLSESRRQLARFLAATPLPLAAGQWSGLSTNPLTVTPGAAPRAKPNGVEPRLEVIYRDPLPGNVTLVAGSFPLPGSLGTMHIAVTVPTAARFGLHPGSVLKLAVASGSVPVIVTAIVRPRMPASAFWNVDAAAGAPSYNVPAPGRAYRPTGRARCSPIRVSSPRCKPCSLPWRCSSNGSSRSASAACRRTRWRPWTIR
jgi:hypothetical protein